MKQTTTLIRIDEVLYEKIKEVAEQQKRSINKQIIFILQNYIDMLTK